MFYPFWGLWISTPLLDKLSRWNRDFNKLRKSQINCFQLPQNDQLIALCTESNIETFPKISPGTSRQEIDGVFWIVWRKFRRACRIILMINFPFNRAIASTIRSNRKSILLGAQCVYAVNQKRIMKHMHNWTMENRPQHFHLDCYLTRLRCRMEKMETFYHFTFANL